MKMGHWVSVPALLLAAALSAAEARAGSIDFESLADLEGVTSQYPGITFSGATAITAGASLNEFDFPPRSGVNVVFDDGGPISILFDTPPTTFTAYFTYISPLALEAFDPGNVPVDLAVSLFGANDGSTGAPGSSPNEALSVFHAGGIRRVIVTGLASGGSFVMDDVTFDSLGEVAVPEPNTLLLVSAAVGILATIQRRRVR